MPFFHRRPPRFNSPKDLEFNWNDFSGGLNTLFNETEIESNELVQADNLMLTGKGIPTKRWGLAEYFKSSATGSVRGMSGFYQTDGTNELLAITDEGFLNKRNGTSFTQINGVSWPSGNAIEMSQLADNMYFVSDGRELARYDGTTLEGFATIAQPSSVFATQISGTSGTHTHSYRLTHTTAVGETVGTDAYTVADQPEELQDGAIRVEWTNASTASGIRKATNIYRGDFGDETFVASVDAEATEWIDDGSAVPALFNFPPKADSTGGMKAKYIKRFQGRLVVAGIDGDPTLVMISGTEPLQERFDFGSNAGIIRIEPDSGDDITGLETKGDKIIVFKERSIWQVDLEQRAYKTINGVTLTALDPQAQLITGSVGCASHRTIAHVENDILFLANGKKGVYVLGNEPGIIGDILRTNEVSVKIRPYFDELTSSQEMNACAVYYNNKYFIGFPGRDETMVFDRERNAWMGPWDFDANLFHIYYDSNDDAQLLKGDDDGPDVQEISPSAISDQGTSFNTVLRTKKEDFGDWTRYKTIRDILTLWRNISGQVSVDIRIEEKDGLTSTVKSFTVSTGSSAGESGWGTDLWANTLWGDTEQAGTLVDTSEFIKQARLNKPGRDIQFIVKTTDGNDNYELMSIKGEGHVQGESRRLTWQA